MTHVDMQVRTFKKEQGGDMMMISKDSSTTGPGKVMDIQKPVLQRSLVAPLLVAILHVYVLCMCSYILQQRFRIEREKEI